MMVPQSQPPEAIVGRAGSSRDMWFHHPSQALPLTATVPRLPNGMERKAGRAQRSVLDLVVATCTAALAGAMSVVPPDPRRVAGVVPSASRPCPDVICTGESRRRQSSDVRPVRARSPISAASSRLRRRQLGCISSVVFRATALRSWRRTQADLVYAANA